MRVEAENPSDLSTQPTDLSVGGESLTAMTISHHFFTKSVQVMKHIALRYGLWMFLGFTGFFLLMHLLDLSQNYYLRVFNGIIHVGFLWMALRTWYRDHHEPSDDYTSGVVMGMFTSFAGVLPFTVFMVLFLAYNPSFLASIQSQSPIGQYFTPVTASLFILVEGIAASLILSYVMVRLLEVMRERA